MCRAKGDENKVFFPREPLVTAISAQAVAGNAGSHFAPPPAPAVMFDEVEPADICQGSLGDCWFLSSVACLAAEFPGMVRALLVEEETDAAVGKATFR